MTQSNCNLRCGFLRNSDWSCEESYLLFFEELMQAVFTQLLLDALVKVLSFCLIVGNCSKCSIHMSKNKVKICTNFVTKFYSWVELYFSFLETYCSLLAWPF